MVEFRSIMLELTRVISSGGSTHVVANRMPIDHHIDKYWHKCNATPYGVRTWLYDLKSVTEVTQPMVTYLTLKHGPDEYKRLFECDNR